MLQVGSDKGKLRIVYSYLGNVHYSLGNYGRAMEYHRQVSVDCIVRYDLVLNYVFADIIVILTWVYTLRTETMCDPAEIYLKVCN